MFPIFPCPFGSRAGSYPRSPWLHSWHRVRCDAGMAHRLGSAWLGSGSFARSIIVCVAPRRDAVRLWGTLYPTPSFSSLMGVGGARWAYATSCMTRWQAQEITGALGSVLDALPAGALILDVYLSVAAAAARWLRSFPKGRVGGAQDTWRALGWWWRVGVRVHPMFLLMRLY